MKSWLLETKTGSDALAMVGAMVVFFGTIWLPAVVNIGAVMLYLTVCAVLYEKVKE